MTNRRKLRLRAISGAGALLGTAVAVAACGSSASAPGTAASATPAAATGASPAAATGYPAANTGAAASTAAAAPAHALALGMATGTDGAYLTATGGRAVYLWLADTGNRSSCAGACASAWPPLTVKTAALASHGVMASALGTITRADGSRQVTYHGHPLYYFAGDPTAGTTNGQGSDEFGARWWLVAPSGSALVHATVASGGSATQSAAGGGWG